MEAQDILKMLTNLEQSLQNVESARQQVTNTVNAYEGTKAQLHALTVEFKEVSSELNKVYNAIKENVDSIDETLKIKIDSVFKSISKKWIHLMQLRKKFSLHLKSHVTIPSILLRIQYIIA